MIQRNMPALKMCNLKLLLLFKAPYPEATQEQLGDNDCGLLSIAYATELCNGNDASSLRYHQDRLRFHLIECSSLNLKN